jgi:recombinational DNA repair protein (RecF pathway)
VNDQLLQTINAIITESSTKSQAPELIDTLKNIYKMALRSHMEKNLKS